MPGPRYPGQDGSDGLALLPYTTGMTPDQLELAKKALEELFKPYANIIERVLGPTAKEIGDFLGDAVGLSLRDRLHERRTMRQLKFWTTVKTFVEDAGIDPQPVPDKLSLPILQNASLEDSDYLTDKWAALLTNSAACDAAVEVFPSFPDILRQLTPVEAHFLDALFMLVDGELRRRQERYTGPENIVLDDDILRRRWIEITEPTVRYEELALTDQAFYDNMMSPFLDNLTRLGLLDSKPTVERRTPRAVAFTVFGFRFVRACRKPKRNTIEPN